MAQLNQTVDLAVLDEDRVAFIDRVAPQSRTPLAPPRIDTVNTLFGAH